MDVDNGLDPLLMSCDVRARVIDMARSNSLILVQLWPTVNDLLGGKHGSVSEILVLEDWWHI